MESLSAYRSQPSTITPAAFSQYITGATVLHLYDPSPRTKRSYSERRFWPGQAAALALRQYSPFWSLNIFKNGERKERYFESMLAVGVDIDCATTEEFKMITAQDLDSRKNAALLKLLVLNISPHMVNETPKGLHIVFFVERRAGPEGLLLYKSIMPLLVGYFGADDAAALVTQLLRFPNAWHQKNPEKPSLCTCLIDRLTIPPYKPEMLLALLQERCPPPVPRKRTMRQYASSSNEAKWRPASLHASLLSRTHIRIPARKWQTAMYGVGEGHRNDAAASVAGMLLRKYDREAWQSHAWSAFQEWNERNSPPLGERELQSVFESIQRTVEPEHPSLPTVRVRVQCSLGAKTDVTVSSISPMQP